MALLVRFRVECRGTAAAAAWRNSVGDQHRSIRLDDVASVLWRWPTSPAGHPAIDNPDRRAWAAREDTLALYGVLKTLPVRWVNHPDRVAVANTKPGQLITAQQQCGLTVPRTIITTSGETARLWGRTIGDVLYKAFLAQGSGGNGMVVASRADLAALPDELGAASIFQEVIKGSSVEDLSGDSCLTHYTENLRDGTSLRIGAEPLRTCEWWWVEPDHDDTLTYLGRGYLRHHPGRGTGHLMVAVRPSRRREGHGSAILAALLPLAYTNGIDPACVICPEDDIAARKMIEACGGVIEQYENGQLRYRLSTNCDAGLAHCLGVRCLRAGL